MTVTGTVIQILPVESGVSKSSGKEWKKGGFIVETDGQYPKKICITLFGKALENVAVQQGMKYDVEVDVSSRDYTNPTTGKVSWFTEVSAYKATPVAEVASGSSQSYAGQGYQQAESLYKGQTQGAYPPQQTPTQQGGEDLPF